MPALARIAGAGAILLAAALPAQADEQLLFCNRPERIRMPGKHAETRLEADRTYRIFFHYRNGTAAPGFLVVAFHQLDDQPLALEIRKGIGEPHTDPARPGKQGMARFLNAERERYAGQEAVRFPIFLKPQDVASGVLSVRVVGLGARFSIYYRHNGWVVPNSRIISVKAPRRDYRIDLTAEDPRRYFRIGIPEAGMSRYLNGTYGLVYSFRVNAPAGSRVRIAFSPRGGRAGLVGTLGGVLHQSRVVRAWSWNVLGEAVVGEDGLVVTTLPFGGVFYPVELAFQLV